MNEANRTGHGMDSNIGLAFFNGGPRAMVWGFFIVVPGVLCQVASIAELASVQPIAGAQYHWTWQFAPPQCTYHCDILQTPPQTLPSIGLTNGRD